MNWKLIFLLSLFGLAMAIATVYVVPSNVEPMLWIPIFLVCAYLIARNVARLPFLHGLFLGLANCVWITGAHVLLAKDYLATHAREAAMMASGPLATHPRIMMLIVGPFIGVISGAVIGLLSIVAAKLLRRPTAPGETVQA